MNSKILLSLLASCCFSLTACTSAKTLSTDDTATSKSKEWTVTNIGGRINTEYHEGWSTVSEDGLSLYFGSNRPGGVVQSNKNDGWDLAAKGGLTNYDMYVSHRATVNDEWGEPTILAEPLNTEHNEHSASVSPDGHHLFFASSRPGGCGAIDLYVSYREDVNDDTAWQAPKNLGCQKDGGPNGDALDSCPIFHVDEQTKEIKLYYTGSTELNPVTLDFRYTVFDPESLTAKGSQILNMSTEYFDAHIEPRLGYIWGVYPDGLGGGDIWLSHNDGSDQWSKPINLGASINTEYEEQIPSPNHDGSILYFPSNRPGGYGGMDIYQATIN